MKRLHHFTPTSKRARWSETRWITDEEEVLRSYLCRSPDSGIAAKGSTDGRSGITPYSDLAPCDYFIFPALEAGIYPNSVHLRRNAVKEQLPRSSMRRA
ncbi:hypothetical protein NPIL_284691 [Nephila pilipes]|uniref:Uncharacterized protein n=1 Tax=Nephila pilipes TaxID=299642 RepID=A0A8X6PCF0_NEPPI|nr:hypothetical protein NPIL_284691 [Nephila pilipes]